MDGLKQCSVHDTGLSLFLSAVNCLSCISCMEGSYSKGIFFLLILTFHYNVFSSVNMLLKTKQP